MDELKLTRPEELDQCFEIIDLGRAFQQKQGFVQWTDDYPGKETIQNDIATGKTVALMQKINIDRRYMDEFEN